MYFVELFLVVSGFVAFMVYTDKIDNGLSFGKYALRRIIRIYPLMIAGHIIALPLYFLHRISFGQDWVDLGSNTIEMFFLDVTGTNLIIPGLQTWNYPSWSLAIFFLCWIIYYWLIYFSRKKPDCRAGLCLLIVILGFAFSKGAMNAIAAIFSAAAARGYIPFFAGGLIYYLDKILDTSQKRGAVIVCISFFVLALCLDIADIPVGNYTIVFGGFLFPMAVFFILNNKLLSSILSLPPLVYLGKISFSIYLCNFPLEMLLAWLHKNGYIYIDFSSPQFFFANIILHILVGSVFCKIFEGWIPGKLRKLCNV